VGGVNDDAIDRLLCRVVHLAYVVFCALILFGVLYGAALISNVGWR